MAVAGAGVGFGRHCFDFSLAMGEGFGMQFGFFLSCLVFFLYLQEKKRRKRRGWCRIVVRLVALECRFVECKVPIVAVAMFNTCNVLDAQDPWI